MGNISRRILFLYLLLCVTCLTYLCSVFIQDTSLTPPSQSPLTQAKVAVPYGYHFAARKSSQELSNELFFEKPDKSSNSSRIGVDTSQDFQVITDSWQTEWSRLNHELESSQPIKLYLPDGLRWWSLTNGLQCIQGLHCQVSEDFPDNELHVDGVVNVRDFAHTTSLRLGIPNVTHIYFALESPYAATFAVKLNPEREFLASYWRGSDLWTPYYRWKYNDPAIRFKPQAIDYTQGKTKKVAIVVSNCRSRNKRLEYVKELAKYIDVDVFGRCGNHDCSTTDCFPIIKKDYKFYLSFENSNCRDYITEKLSHNALENHVLPIVMGAHPSDYKAIAPEGSYLHVEDFSSPKELAEYLKILDSNHTLYNQYFQWLGTGNWVDQKALCEVCAFLHLKKSGKIQNITRDKLPYLNHKDVYSDARFNYKSSNQLLCLPPDKWYWEREG